MNNVANINDVSNSVKATPSILHCGTLVITTGIMAKLYGTDEANVKMNFSRNADRFIEGKHYFKLEGVELKGFKDRVTESYPVKFHDQIVGKRARSLAPNFYEMPREAMRKANLLRRTIEKATEHIQIKRNEFSEWRILHRIRIPDMPW